MKKMMITLGLATMLAAAVNAQSYNTNATQTPINGVQSPTGTGQYNNNNTSPNSNNVRGYNVSPNTINTNSYRNNNNTTPSNNSLQYKPNNNSLGRDTANRIR